jgi:chromosome segregation ATPase
MSETNTSAEQRYRDAFERLKSNTPNILPRGSAVSQNNVAKEAGTDPSALKKSRFSKLIREIQAFKEIDDAKKLAREARQKRRREKSDLETRLNACVQQRDHAQSQLVSAHRKVLELFQENARLQARLNDLLPPIKTLG